mmetsp:Transcript_5881/g.18707  ORF Transcript_5881/g.18707 Transcript_5881/m.18707 type:complete len:203 (+) Transcript_5881:440-1048(+)
MRQLQSVAVARCELWAEDVVVRRGAGDERRRREAVQRGKRFFHRGPVRRRRVAQSAAGVGGAAERAGAVRRAAEDEALDSIGPRFHAERPPNSFHAEARVALRAVRLPVRTGQALLLDVLGKERRRLAFQRGRRGRRERRPDDADHADGTHGGVEARRRLGALQRKRLAAVGALKPRGEVHRRQARARRRALLARHGQEPSQ